MGNIVPNIEPAYQILLSSKEILPDYVCVLMIINKYPH